MGKDRQKSKSVHRKQGYRAAYGLLVPGVNEALFHTYKAITAKNDPLIAELGAWSNSLLPDEELISLDFHPRLRNQTHLARSDPSHHGSYA